METAAVTVTTAPTSSARSGRVDMAAACRIRGRRTLDVRQRWTWLDTDTLGRMADRIDHDLVPRTNRLYTLADSQQRKFLDAMSIEIFGKRLKDLGLSDE